MELRGQAAQDSRTGKARLEQKTLTATGRIQVSPAETRPPERVKIAQTLLIWSTLDRVWRAPPHLVGFAEGGPCCVLARVADS